MEKLIKLREAAWLALNGIHIKKIILQLFLSYFVFSRQNCPNRGFVWKSSNLAGREQKKIETQKSSKTQLCCCTCRTALITSRKDIFTVKGFVVNWEAHQVDVMPKVAAVIIVNACLMSLNREGMFWWEFLMRLWTLTRSVILIGKEPCGRINNRPAHLLIRNKFRISRETLTVDAVSRLKSRHRAPQFEGGNFRSVRLAPKRTVKKKKLSHLIVKKFHVDRERHRNELIVLNAN